MKNKAYYDSPDGFSERLAQAIPLMLSQHSNELDQFLRTNGMDRGDLADQDKMEYAFTHYTMPSSLAGCLASVYIEQVSSSDR